MRKVLSSLVLFVGVLALLPAAQASVQMALQLSELVAQSEHVVLANAEQTQSRFAGRVIVTDATLKVVSVLKGSARAGSTLTATYLGGSVGDVGLEVPGAPRFSIGQSAIVFLQRGETGNAHTFNITGMGQGVLPVTGNGKSAEVDTAGTGGAKLMQRDAQGTVVDMPTQPQRKRVLGDVLGEIDQLVKKR